MRHAISRVGAVAVAGILLTPTPGAEMMADPKVRVRVVLGVDENLPAALALLQRAVDQNSGTMNLAGVQAVGALFRAELDALGFRTHWVDGAPFARAGHLLAERTGTGVDPLRVLLIGHLDTVFEKDSPFQRYEPLQGDQARGPGVTDMKGGDVVMLLALQALRAAGVLERFHVAVILTGDEEDMGRPLSLSRTDLLAAADKADLALGFEDGDGSFARAVIARRGTEQWTLQVTGTPAHSSLVMRADTGAGAIYEAARILDAFRRELAAEDAAVTFNPGRILGGTTVEDASDAARGTAFGKTNVIAGRVTVVGDLRTFTPEQLARTKERMREIVAQSLPHTRAELTFENGYPPMAATEGNRRLLAALDEASRELGLGPVTAVDPRNAGAADISFVAGRVPMALDALGMKGTGGHTVQETADLSTLGGQAKRVALMLVRLAQHGRAALLAPKTSP